jgi:hypothetical protein
MELVYIILIIFIIWYLYNTLNATNNLVINNNTQKHINTNLKNDKKSNYTKNEKKMLYFIINKLVRQSARWATAAKQDKNSMIAVLHANYGAGYLWALKDIAKTEDIEEATGIDILKFEAEIVNTQDTATKYMAKLCPEYAPEPSYLTKIAGEA